MSLLEKYRPKTFKELIPSKDLDKKIDQLKQSVQNKTPTILYGNAGIGKTTIVHVTANELGYTVIETNSSNERKKENMQQTLKQVQHNTFTPTLFLFDEADGLNYKNNITSIILEILQKTRHPIIMTANNIQKIPYIIQKQCTTIRLYEPNITDIAKRVKEISQKENMKIHAGEISTDIRSTFLKVFYGGEVYDKQNMFNRTKQILQKQVTNINNDDLTWLLDNSSNYTGRNLIEFHELLSLSELYGLHLLKEIPKARNPYITYPYFIKRSSLLKTAQKH